MRDRDGEFADFVRTYRGGLVATARLLAAGDAHLAEDLVQTALVRVYLSWGRARSGNPVGYARRTLVNCTADHHRRGPVGSVPPRRCPKEWRRPSRPMTSTTTWSERSAPSRPG